MPQRAGGLTASERYRPGAGTSRRLRGLAGGTPVRHPLGLTRLPDPDGRPAAETRPAATTIHPVGPSRARVAGGDLTARRPVGLEELLHERDEAFGSRHAADGRPRVDSVEKAKLALPHVARARDHALVEEQLADRSLRVRGEASQRVGGVPAGTERIRPQMSYHLVLTHRLDQLDHREPEADRDPCRALEP